MELYQQDIIPMIIVNYFQHTSSPCPGRGRKYNRNISTSIFIRKKERNNPPAGTGTAANYWLGHLEE